MSQARLIYRALLTSSMATKCFTEKEHKYKFMKKKFRYIKWAALRASNEILGGIHLQLSSSWLFAVAPLLDKTINVAAALWYKS